jgi:hypothetical protein
MLARPRADEETMLFVAIGTLFVAVSVALLAWSLPKVPVNRD